MSDKDETGLAPHGRWSPFSELDLLEQIDAFGKAKRMRNLLGELLGEGRPGVRAFTPAIDVAESDEEYVVSAELPGSKRDDVSVELHEGVLSIRGEKKRERDETKELARYVERCYGTFSRSFTLPANADGDRLRAAFVDGVLTLHIPKREETKARVINVQSG